MPELQGLTLQRKILFALAVLGILLLIAIAQADPVQEFSFQLKNVQKDGRFTVVFRRGPTTRAEDNRRPCPATTCAFRLAPSSTRRS